MEVILGYFGFTEFGVLEFSRFFSLSLVCLNFSGFFRNVFSCVWSLIKFSVLVDLVFRLGPKLLCLFPFLFSFIADIVTFIF